MTRLTPASMLLIACPVLARIRSIIAVISWVDWVVRAASPRTSSATTAKPRPASPARAASMAAFNASRLVCSAIPLITWMIEWISSDDWPRAVMLVEDWLTTSAMRLIPSTTLRITCPPLLASSSDLAEITLALSAWSEICEILVIISSMLAAMLVALSACWLAPWTIDCEVWPMDWEVSWSSSLSWRMMVIICRRFSCISPNARCNWPASSLLSTPIGSCRLPWAITRADETSLRSGCRTARSNWRQSCPRTRQATRMPPASIQAE